MRNTLILCGLCLLGCLSTGCTPEAMQKWQNDPTGQLSGLESGRGRSARGGSYIHRDVTVGKIAGVPVAVEVTERNRVRSKNGRPSRVHSWEYDIESRRYGYRSGLKIKGTIRYGARRHWYDEKDKNGHAKGDSRYTRAD